MCLLSWITTTFSRTLERKLILDTGQFFFMLSFLREGFFKRGQTLADLRCEGKELSVSDKLIIDVIGVTSYTSLMVITDQFYLQCITLFLVVSIAAD